MRKLTALVFFCSLLISHSALALLSLELTHGVAGAVPIQIDTFEVNGWTPPQDLSEIIKADLQNSGRFSLVNQTSGNRVTGKIDADGMNYRVQFKLHDTVKGRDTVLVNKGWRNIPPSRLRALAHAISDIIYQEILGVRGVFSTRLAYILVQRSSSGPTQYVLEVADQDGYNPRPLLISPDPIMSPAWAPNGRDIAYVSFENKQASIYVENVINGQRHLISRFPGINGAPAWSPDGRKLALVLSKSGSPNIYMLDLASRRLSQVTNDWSINTEPAWSPRGGSLLFTSNRGGAPQIYKYNFATRATSRVTYDGDYNARASFTHDGRHIVMLHRDSGIFNIGILDLDTSNFRVLTTSGKDNDSPTIAPNGSMVIYGTYDNGRSVLGMVSSDGGVQLRLPAREGEVQDPAWSPYLS